MSLFKERKEMEYPLAEKIGHPELFVGREKEFKWFNNGSIISSITSQNRESFWRGVRVARERSCSEFLMSCGMIQSDSSFSVAGWLYPGS